MTESLQHRRKRPGSHGRIGLRRPALALHHGNILYFCCCFLWLSIDLGALAEHRRGLRPGIDDLIYVAGEFGIGAGVIVDGRPLRGAAGYAGEAGHTLINPAGLECRCGSIGCWETEAGEVALLRHAGLTEGAGRVDEIAELAAVGDEPTLRAIAEIGRWLGFGIGNLINIFNPDLVVLGGLYQRLFTYLEPSVDRRSRTADPRLPPGALATIAVLQPRSRCAADRRRRAGAVGRDRRPRRYQRRGAPSGDPRATPAHPWCGSCSA